MADASSTGGAGGFMGRPGFGMVRDIPRPDADLVEALARADSAMVSDALGQRGALAAAIKPLDASMRLCGPAITVETREGDNLMVHAAIAIARPGDIIVVDGRGCMATGLLGGLVALAAHRRGIGGFVFDGAVRDGAEMIEMGLAVFCRGTSPVGPDHDGPGQVNLPISCGGVQIAPGDVIFGDDGGVVSVPRAQLEAVVAFTAEKAERDARRAKEIEQGAYNQNWLVPTLRKHGILGEDEDLP